MYLSFIVQIEQKVGYKVKTIPKKRDFCSKTLLYLGELDNHAYFYNENGRNTNLENKNLKKLRYEKYVFTYIGNDGLYSVSYTHLTLPTIYSV